MTRISLLEALRRNWTFKKPTLRDINVLFLILFHLVGFWLLLCLDVNILHCLVNSDCDSLFMHWVMYFSWSPIIPRTIFHWGLPKRMPMLCSYFNFPRKFHFIQNELKIYMYYIIRETEFISSSMSVRWKLVKDDIRVPKSE